MEKAPIVVLTIGIWVVTALCGVIPILLVRKLDWSNTQKGLKFRSGLNCLVAGVFLALSLIHMLPEVRESFHKARYPDAANHNPRVHQNEKYEPYPEITLLVGISMILLLEQLAHTYLDYGDFDSDHEMSDDISLDEKPSRTQESVVLTPVVFSTPGGRVRRLTAASRCTSVHSITGGNRITPYGQELSTRSGSVATLAEQAAEIMQRRSQWRSLTLFLALAIHAVFEGISLYQVATSKSHHGEHRYDDHDITGMSFNSSEFEHGHEHDHEHEHDHDYEHDHRANREAHDEENEAGPSPEFITFVLAIIFHKSIMAVTLALKLANLERLSDSFILTLVVLFASMTPIGVTFVLVFEDILPTLLIAILSGLSAGTFIYIVFFEILAEEFGCVHVEVITKHSLSKIQKAFFFISGMGIIVSTTFFTGHAHSH